jgi:predicted exporter
MFERLFGLASEFVRRRRRSVLWLVVAASIAASFGAFFIDFESSIDLMFPDDRDIRRSITFLRDSKLSDKVIVSLELIDTAKGKAELFRAADQLAERLLPPLFTRVTTGISLPHGMEDLSILQFAPQMMGERELARLDKRLTAENVSAQLREIRRGAMKLESVFTSSLVRSDPIGVRGIVFERLRALPASMGYDVSVEDGHFVSADHAHTMVIIETPVKITDSRETRELIAALKEQVRLLPPSVAADIISGHVHTASNEKVVKHDIQIASTLATVSFLLFFLLVFPDRRIVLVFLIPVVAIALSIETATLFIGPLSYLVIGIGTAVAGITVDHGLHMYIALRKDPSADQALRVARLITIDAITTVFGFGALFLSQVRGYHQLAFFAILCVLFSLALSIFILPLTLSWKSPPAMRSAEWGERAVSALWPKRSPVYIWAGLTIAALLFAVNIPFESDIMRLDGSEPEVWEAERRFHEAWGGKNEKAVFVAAGRTLEDALETNDAVYREAVRTIGEGPFISLSMLWPSERTRRENVQQWNRFWKDGRAERLKRLLGEQAPQYGMRPEAFAPFFEGLYGAEVRNGKQGSLFENLRERFVVQNGDEYRILSFFPDEQETINALMPVSNRIPDTFIVSRKALSKTVSAFTVGEVKFLVPVAVLFNVVLTWLFFRNVKETIIALTPLITGVIWLAGFMAVLDIPLDVVNIIGMVVVSGVIVDYGMGVTYEYRNKLKIGTVTAVSLSAITTILGSGVLLFADHPVLFSIGVSMTVSVLAGYLTAILVVPPLCDLFMSARTAETTT